MMAKLIEYKLTKSTGEEYAIYKSRFFLETVVQDTSQHFNYLRAVSLTSGWHTELGILTVVVCNSTLI